MAALSLARFKATANETAASATIGRETGEEKERAKRDRRAAVLKRDIDRKANVDMHRY